MTYVSRISPQDFIEVLSKIEGQTMENVVEFPLEYFVSDSFVFLYKQVMNKLYKTVVIVVENDVVWKGNEMSFDQFITDLRVNHKGKELLEPVDVVDLYVKHVHDMHDHAGTGFDDVLL